MSTRPDIPTLREYLIMTYGEQYGPELYEDLIKDINGDIE